MGRTGIGERAAVVTGGIVLPHVSPRPHPATVAQPVPSCSPEPVAARAQVESLIEERLGSAMLTVSALCRWTGMSRSSLYRLFDGDGGVQSVIRARRLARVAEDLRTGTPDKLTVVAERWGFCDAAYLARVFREVHGVTPSVYRTLHRPRA